MKKIMILGASILQLPAIKKAKEMGLTVVAVDMNPEAVGFKESGIICECISTIDLPKVLEAAQKHNIDGIMTLASDMPMRTVAYVSETLGILGISSDTAYKATNKIAMRKCLKECNVPVPEFYQVKDLESFLEAARKFTKSFIVKPADNSGSRGVVKIEDKGDKRDLVKAFEYSKESSRDGWIIVEKYMNGPEVSVETISIDGKCNVIQITDKITTGVPYFVEMGHTQPTRYQGEMKTAIEKAAIQAVEAIGIVNGPAHTEIKITENGPMIVELGARLGGDNITTHLVPLSTGVDMVGACIKLAIGEIPDIFPRFEKGAAIRYFNPKQGKIISIKGQEEAEKMEGIYEVNFTKKVGEDVGQIRSSIDRIGYVISQADSGILAGKACEQAMKKIVIEIEEDENDNIGI